MKRPRVRVIVAIVVGVPAVLAVVLFGQDWYTRWTKPQLPPAPPQHEPRLVLEPSSIDLGRRSQCDGLIRVRAKIRNASNEPAILDDWIGSCGCTVPFGELRRGMTIAPGESREFEIASDAWSGSGPKSFTVDFIERWARQRLTLTMKYIVESPLYTTASYLIRSADPTTDLVVRSRDRQPFRILSIEPPVARVDPEQSAAEHTLKLDWSLVEQALGPEWLEGELRIRTDRDDCPELHFRIQGPPVMPEAPADPAPEPPPGRPAAPSSGSATTSASAARAVPPHSWRSGGLRHRVASSGSIGGSSRSACFALLATLVSPTPARDA